MKHFRTSLALAILLSVGILRSEAPAALLLSGSELRIDWVDDLGNIGFIVIDPQAGYDASGISAFSYIDVFGNPTPIGFLPPTFTPFAGFTAWDFNTGVEGVDFSWDIPMTEPLSGDPLFYEAHFTGGNFLTTLGTRTWGTIDVKLIPEPAAGALSTLGALAFLACRRRRPRS